MKKYIILALSSVIVWGTFAYNFVKTPTELLSEYIQNKCWVTEYGIAQKVTYENYKQIWEDICAFEEIGLEDEDASILAEFIQEVRNLK